MNQVAIVILNYNGKAHLECFLPSVVKHQQDQTIIIADNASTDNSLEFLKINYPNIRIIENDENFGFAKGYNEALNKINEELCPAGKAYIKRRKAAGEKSSAYLSGRAVKVCKGQMSGKTKKK